MFNPLPVVITLMQTWSSSANLLGLFLVVLTSQIADKVSVNHLSGRPVMYIVSIVSTQTLTACSTAQSRLGILFKSHLPDNLATKQ